MKTSIIILNTSPVSLERCMLSIKSQTVENAMSFVSVIDTSETDSLIALNDYFHTEKKNIKNKNYYLIMTSDNYLENDNVLEDMLLNEIDKDLVFYDSVLNKGEDFLSREHIISSKTEKLSDVILSPFSFQSTLIKGEVLLNYTFNINIDLYSSMRLFILDAILNKRHSYKHVYLPVLHLDMDVEAYNGICGVLNDEYVEALQKDFPMLYDDYKTLMEYNIEKQDEVYRLLQKIKKSKLFSFILKLRNLAHKLGYYKRKAKRREREFLKQQSQRDLKRKKEVERLIHELSHNMLKRNNDETDVIVSLTSHSRRVIDSVPYAIYSMFKQTVLPNRIVLFINKDHWNDDKLPPLIKRLMQSGLEVEYCRDVRSHTKLIPALKKFPENAIITLDDDIYYQEKTIEQLLNAYETSDKKSVICHQGCFPQKRHGKFLPYSYWETSKYVLRQSTKHSLSASAYGVSGVIYPPHIFPDEVFNKNVFLKIAPHTDDIWFWIMEYMNGVKIELVPNSLQEKNRSVDYEEYVNPDGSLALYFENCFNGRNDKELRALLDYYGIEKAEEESDNSKGIN